MTGLTFDLRYALRLLGRNRGSRRRSPGRPRPGAFRPMRVLSIDPVLALRTE